MADEVIIRLREGDSTGVVVVKRGEVQSSKTIPIDDIPQLIAMSVREQQGDGAVARGATVGLGDYSNPLNWDVNLFPRIPYARIGTPGKMALVVGAFAQEVKDLKWMGGREIRVTVPKRLWVAAYNHGGVGSSFLFTFPDRAPLNVNDETSLVFPWKMGNVDANGWMCWGTTNRPGWIGDGLFQVDHSFFYSTFNDHIHRNGEDMMRWWRGELERAGGPAKGAPVEKWETLKAALPEGFAPLIPHDTRGVNIVQAIKSAATSHRN